MESHWVITGGTGFIGRHFLYRALRDQEGLRFTLLVRGTELERERNRVLSQLSEVAQDYGEYCDVLAVSKRVQVVLCDLTEPGCGVCPEDMEHLRGEAPSALWHFAASLRFEEADAACIQLHNVTGTRHALELAQRVGVRRFVHVSTAYACGAASGTVEEQLHGADRSFHNEYERSKCLAEHLVYERCAAIGVDCCIVRPSIVVGLSGSGAPSGGTTGLYGFARELLRLGRRLARATRPIRLVADPDGEVNFIPVDLLAAELLELAVTGFEAGSVHHSTSTQSPTARETLDAITAGLGLPGFELVPELPEDASPLERLIARRTCFYGSYLRGERRFARARPTAIRVTAEDLQRFVARSVEERARPRALSESRTVHARDGFPLRVSIGGGLAEDRVILVNALGMPKETLAALRAALGSRFELIEWESRGAPSLCGVLDRHTAALSRQVDDLEDLLNHRRVSEAHVVGWCTGADVALEFARRAPARIRSLVCLHGAFAGLGCARTAFQHNLDRIVRRAARSEEHAALYHALLASACQIAPPAMVGDPETRAAVHLAVGSLDPELMHLTGVPLRSALALHRYCVLLERYLDEAPRSVPKIQRPALVCTTEDDTIAHCEASRFVARSLPFGRLRIRARGGHFAPCRDEALLSDVLQFLTEHIGARPGSLASCDPEIEPSRSTLRGFARLSAPPELG